MVTIVRLGGLTLLLSNLLLLILHGQSAPTRTPSRSTLAGTVVNSVTNAGIPHALVTFIGPATGFRFTDASGAFHVEDVPEGQYHLAVSRPGFVSEEDAASHAYINQFDRTAEETDGGLTDQYGHQPSEASEEFELTSGSQPARVKLMPLGSLSGTVVDENSVPLEGVAVQAIEVRRSLAGVDYNPVALATTDDRGSYLILNLVAGDYVVRLAGEVSGTRPYIGRLNPDNNHRGLRPVYYPSEDSTSSASGFHLTAGDRVKADFQQRTAAAFDIDGLLGGYRPQSRADVELYVEGDPLPIGRSFVNVSSGRFRVIDVPPGAYLLRATQFGGDPPQLYAAEVPVVVTSEPIRGLEVDLSGGHEIPVSIAYENGAVPGGRVTVALLPQHSRGNVRRLALGKGASGGLGAGNGVPEAAPAQPVVLPNVIPDTYRLTVSVRGTGYVDSARLGKEEILYREFRVGTAHPGEIRIVVKGDGAIVQGQVSLSGKPASLAFVYLVPVAGLGMGAKSGVTDQMGSYKIVGVPPGEYHALAFTTPPSEADLSSASGQTLSLQAGEARTLALEVAAPGTKSTL